MIKIIVDSTADLPKELLLENNIRMIPVIVHIDHVEYKDKTTITTEELYESLKNGHDCKTSQPNYMDIYNAFEEEAKNGHDIIVIALSEKLSGTYSILHMVAKEIMEIYSKITIKVVNSKGGSMAPGLMALQAARLAKMNHKFDEIVGVMEDLANHCEHLITVDNLKYLIKSGRLNKTSAFIGNILNVKPILHLVDGEIQLLQKVRGKKKLLDALVDLVILRMKDFPDQIIGIAHAEDLETALQVKELIMARINTKGIIIERIGSAIGTHIGIGGIGIFFFNKAPKHYIL